eukprot:c15774_g1_i1 orf=341-1300(+)
MIDTAALNSRVWPKHADTPLLMEIEHDWRHRLNYGASKLEPLSLSTRIYEQEQHLACVRDAGQERYPAYECDVGQPLFTAAYARNAGQPLFAPAYACDVGQEQHPAYACDVGQPSFAPMAHQLKDGSQKSLEVEEVLHKSEEPSAARHVKDDDWKDLTMEDALARLAFTLPSTEDFVCVVQICREEKVLSHARQLHAHICYHGLDDYRVLGNFLVAMFVDCGSLCAAQQAFDRLVWRKEHSWTALIHGYIEGAESQHALNLYTEMKDDHVRPSKYTFLALLKACTKLKCLERGREIENEISKNRLDEDLFVGNALVDMY